MTSAKERVVEEALSLQSDIRISLVEKLLASINFPVDEEIDRLWAEEAERRVSQIEEGKADLVPGEEVFAKIRAKYGK